MCGDRVFGFYYGVIFCEGCKVIGLIFFFRNIEKYIFKIYLYLKKKRKNYYVFFIVWCNEFFIDIIIYI